MFTTLQALRNSSAMQSRVDTVEKFLKKQQADWAQDAKFPIFLIGNSNIVDDVEWVVDNKSCHVAWPEMETAVLKRDGYSARDHMSNYISAMSRNKAATIKGLTYLYNAAYQEVHGQVPNLINAAPDDTPTSTSTESVAATISEIPTNISRSLEEDGRRFRKLFDFADEHATLLNEAAGGDMTLDQVRHAIDISK